MKARTICMASAKGGSGKTSIVASFGAFLAVIGRKVLLVDTDAATNGLTFLYLKEVLLFQQKCKNDKSSAKGVYDFEDITDEIKVIHLPTNVDLVPATFKFQNTEEVSSSQYHKSLKNIIEKMSSIYDYIFLDAQAGSDIFAQIAMSSEMSDDVVLVSEYDPMSAAGIERLKGLMSNDLTYVRTFILLNKMLPDFVKSFSDFMEIAKYLSPIPWSKDVVLSYARRRLALDFENGNEFTLAVMQTLKGMLGEEISKDLKEWSKEKATVIKEPLEIQYRDAEKELEVLYREKKSLSRSNLLRNQFQKMMLMTLTITITGSVIFTPYFDKIWSVFGGYKASIAGIFVGMMVLGMAAIAPYLRDKSSKYDVIEDRLDRRISLLHEKLKTLETLKDADLETLIKTKL